jgi:hypothetical protein
MNIANLEENSTNTNLANRCLVSNILPGKNTLRYKTGAYYAVLNQNSLVLLVDYTVSARVTALK